MATHNRAKEPHAQDPRKLSSGRWQARVTYYDAETGDRHEIGRTFDTERAAKKWGREQEIQYREDPNRKPPSVETVQEYLERWFPQMLTRRSLTPSSVARYRADMAHVVRLIGQRQLNTLGPLDIQNVYTTLLAEGKAPATVRHVRVIIHGALQDAVSWDLLTKDPARGTTPPKLPRRELQVPTVEEARALLQAAESDRLHALWVFLSLTGCRRGEALALRWSDIDWGQRVVTIQRTLAGWGAGRVAHAPKTAAGSRQVALSDYLISVLKQHQHIQKLERVVSKHWEENDWVFTTRHGTWLASGHVYEYFKRLAERAGLPNMRPHDLRHAMASYWIANGVPVKVVSERLGHANISITLDIYGHLLPNMQHDAADKMDAWITGQVAGPSTRYPHEK